jgi:hypothetical protein
MFFHEQYYKIVIFSNDSALLIIYLEKKRNWSSIYFEIQEKIQTINLSIKRKKKSFNSIDKYANHTNINYLY